MKRQKPDGLPRIAWKVSEFAEMTGLSEDCIRELLRNGDIPGSKFGSQWLIADAYVKAVAVGVTPVSNGDRL